MSKHPAKDASAQLFRAFTSKFEAERRDPPPAREVEDIPVSFEAITLDWLNATLARDGASVTAFSLGKPDTGTTNRCIINLMWDKSEKDDLPQSVFCKATHTIESRFLMANTGQLSEIMFYNQIRCHIDVEAPVAYLANVNPESCASIIMMSDMSQTVDFCSHATNLTRLQFEMQIRMLARMHGSFYESKAPFLQGLRLFSDIVFTAICNLGLEEAASQGFRKAKKVIPPAIFANEANVWNATVKSLELNAQLPKTLVHGDTHLGNWYITAANKMGLADWQTVSWGHWSRDLAYVLGTAVSTDQRRNWEREMVRVYCAEFQGAGGPHITEEEAWFEVRRQSLSTLFFWTLTFGRSQAMPEMQSEDACLVFIARLSAFIDDHDALSSWQS